LLRRPLCPLQSPPHNTVDEKHYGVSHGWGANLLMWNTDKIATAPRDSRDLPADPVAMTSVTVHEE